MRGVTEEIKGNLWLEKRDNKRDGAIADQRKAGNDNEIRYEAYDGNGSDRSSSGCPDAGRSDRSGKTDGNGIKLHDSAGETPWKMHRVFSLQRRFM